jgi:hypothetical protein
MTVEHQARRLVVETERHLNMQPPPPNWLALTMAISIVGLYVAVGVAIWLAVR